MNDIHDIASLKNAFERARLSPLEHLQENLQRASSLAARNVFTQRHDSSARERANTTQTGALAGVPVTVKDLFDMAGHGTWGGSRVLADRPVALTDAPVVARLQAAGALILGKTNMSEFAYSGVGYNPHFGTPSNAADPVLARVPGGSSSGAGVAVALGIGAAALGTDTGGSVRIPAALNGVVGFKPTARRVPLDGCVPLSFSLDSVGPLARSVADCAAVDAVIADVPVALVPRSLQGLRLLVVETVFMDGLDAAVATAFEAALSCLSSAGAAIERRPVRAVLEVADLQATGGFAAAESWAWHRHLMADRTAWYDPRVAWRIQRGAGISAADYIDLVLARRDWVTRMNQTLAGFDALLAPTVPILAPPMEAIASDEGFFRVNTQLLRNPSIINFWDGCSISLPCQETGLPVGLMVSAAGGQDGALLSVAAEIERVLKKR